MRVSDEQLAEIEAAASGWSGGAYKPAELVPDLAADLREARALLRSLEWRDCGLARTRVRSCPICGWVEGDDGRHAPDCRLAAALGGRGDA